MSGRTDDRAAGGESFEERLVRLGDLVGRLESGRLGLADSIAAYEEGVGLVRVLESQLREVEQRVRLLAGTGAAESDETAAADTAGEESAAADPPTRPGRRSGSSKSATSPGVRRPGNAVRRLPGMDDPAAEA